MFLNRFENPFAALGSLALFCRLINDRSTSKYSCHNILLAVKHGKKHLRAYDALLSLL